MKKGNKTIALFLVFSLLALSGNLYAKKRGAELIITKKDGQQIRGELIAVKKNSLLLSSESGADVTINIAEIRIIEISKKGKAGKDAFYGLLIGGGFGVLFGELGSGLSVELGLRKHTFALWGGLLGGIFGALGGLVVGFPDLHGTVHIEEMTEFEIYEFLEKRRKKARIRDYK